MSDATRMTAPEAGHRVVRITPTTAFLAVSVVVGFLVLRGAFIASHRVLGWAAASVAVAVFVEPLVNQLARFIPRVLAVLLTFLVIGGAVGGLIFGSISDLDREVDRLADVAPEATAELESRDDEIGRIATDLQLTDRAEGFLEEIDERVGSGTGTLAENAPALPVYFVSAILTIFLLVYGPGIARAGAAQIDDEHTRRQVSEVLRLAVGRARRTMAALVVQGTVVGVLTWAVATMIDLPASIVLGLVAGVTAMIPDFGILLGVFPTVALAAGLGPARHAVLILLAAFALQAFEALYVRHRVARRGVAIGPAVVLIVALVGFSIYGIGMAFYGVAYAIFVMAVIDQVPAAREALAD